MRITNDLETFKTYRKTVAYDCGQESDTNSAVASWYYFVMFHL